MSSDTQKPLCSQAWFGRQDKMGFYGRSFLKNSGMPRDDFECRPVIGICNITLYVDHVLLADRGVDFDFLVGRSGWPVPRDNH
jgi:hypothetical protein